MSLPWGWQCVLLAVLLMLTPGNQAVTFARGWMALKSSPCLSTYGPVPALRARRAGGCGTGIMRLRGCVELEILPGPSLLPPVLARSHVADFHIFFSKLLNGRSVPQLPGSFSLLSYLLGNAI